MSILDLDHFTNEFGKLIIRICNMIHYQQMSRFEIASFLLKQGYKPSDIKLAYAGAMLRLEDTQKGYADANGQQVKPLISQV